MLEAARAGRVVRALIDAAVQPDPRLDELRTLVPCSEVPRARLEALVSGVHQGVVGELGPRTYLSLRDLLARGPDLLVAVDGVQDPQNLGSILRTAEAAGAQGVVLPERRTAPLSAAAVKASSGASELLAVCRVAGLASALPELRRAGLWCAGLDAQDGVPPWEFDLTQPVCIVVGGEGAGLHRLVRERCDVTLRIPLRGRVGSLNAGVAAAAALYEVVRQRTLAGK